MSMMGDTYYKNRTPKKLYLVKVEFVDFSLPQQIEKFTKLP